MFRPLILVCGYGSAGEAVIRGFDQCGVPRSAFAAVDWSYKRVEAARLAGVRAVVGDARDSSRLRIAGAGMASEIIICVSDENAPAVTAALREIACETVIKALVDGSEAGEVTTAAGATVTLVVSEIAGHQLAECLLVAEVRTRPR